MLTQVGCSSLHFFWQAGMGQMKLVNRARPIEDVLKDERTPPHLRRLLHEVAGIKAYAESIGLKPTSNYQEYVQWDDDAVVWVVTASHRLRLEPKLWSFPVVGSFNYLGWFSKDDAKVLAEQLEAEGWDVYLRGASAFSTLGWFKDPVISTMLGGGEAAIGDLVNVLIHESVHASFYIPNQSVFNESIADFVADQWTPKYLEKQFGNDSTETTQYLKREKAGELRGELFRAAYQELTKLYESDMPDEAKLKNKEKVLETLKTAAEWKGSINNATLIQFKTYGSGRVEFREVFDSCKGDWRLFWSKIRELREEDFSAPQLEDPHEVILRKKC